MKQTCGTNLLREIAAEAIPADRDPWPLVRNRLPARPALHVLPRPLLAVGMVALLLATLSLSVPGARAAIQSLGVSLLHGNSAPTLAPTAVPQPTAATVQARGPQRSSAPISLAAAQQRASFPLTLPGWLPENLHLEHAYLLAPDSAVSQAATAIDIIAYPETGNGWLGIQQSQGQPARPYGLDANFVQTVQVADVPALYAHGTWDSQSPTASQSGWDPQADASLLTWERNGVTYVLRANGLGLTQQDLIRIAESLR